MTNLWIEATHDHDAERRDDMIRVATIATAEHLGFVLQAESKDDFDDRVALVADQVERKIASLTHNDPAMFPIVHQAVLADWERDFDVIDEQRKAETQRRNARRAYERQVARGKQAMAVSAAGGKTAATDTSDGFYDDYAHRPGQADSSMDPTTVTVSCPEHGEFKVTVTGADQNVYCPTCHQRVSSLKTANVECNSCGHDFTRNPNSKSFYKGEMKCPKCKSTDLKTAATHQCVYTDEKNHSDDVHAVYHGKEEPTYICGYHEQKLGIPKSSKTANSEDGFDDLADWPTAEKTIDAIRDIVTSHSSKMIDGVLVDAQTANVIVQVYDALNDENKVKFAAMPIERMGDAAWRLVSKSSSKSAAWHVVNEETGDVSKQTFDSKTLAEDQQFGDGYTVQYLPDAKTGAWRVEGSLRTARVGDAVVEVADVDGIVHWGAYLGDAIIAEGTADNLGQGRRFAVSAATHLAGENPFAKKDDEAEDKPAEKTDPKDAGDAGDTTDSDDDGEQDGPVQPGEQPEQDPAAQDPAAQIAPQTNEEAKALDPTTMDVGMSSQMSYTMADGAAGQIEVTFIREENGVYYFNGPTGEFGVGQQNGQWQDADGNSFTFGAQKAPDQPIQQAPADPAQQQSAPPQEAQSAPDEAEKATAPDPKADAEPKDDDKKKENPFAKKSNVSEGGYYHPTPGDTWGSWNVFRTDGSSDLNVPYDRLPPEVKAMVDSHSKSGSIPFAQRTAAVDRDLAARARSYWGGFASEDNVYSNSFVSSDGLPYRWVNDTTLRSEMDGAEIKFRKGGPTGWEFKRSYGDWEPLKRPKSDEERQAERESADQRERDYRAWQRVNDPEGYRTWVGGSKKSAAHTAAYDGPISVHTFSSTGDAYNASQSSSDIHMGDVLVVPDEKVVGFLLSAWPTAVTKEVGDFHAMSNPSGPIQGQEWDTPEEVARWEEGRSVAMGIARQNGWELA